ncbi:hypothetical protein KSS87_012363 [Heliosperma pusillum]|nr:hypothetical protein KSS87_012363 [Heliosperma pusillum]
MSRCFLRLPVKRLDFDAENVKNFCSKVKAYVIVSRTAVWFTAYLLRSLSCSSVSYGFCTETWPSLGIMSTMTAMVSHQHPGGSGPHPHGWLQFHHTPFQAQHPLPPSLPMPMGNGSGRFDSQRSLPRFIPPSRVYEPSGGFSVYGETPMNYSHPWVRDNHLRFPLQ